MRRSRPVARGPIKVSLEEEIAHLRGLKLKGLRARWLSVTGQEAPPHLSRQLLFAIVAYRLQAEALGDLDAQTLRLLKKIGSARSGTEVIPLTDAYDQRRQELLPGTILTREWNGQTHRVMVVKEGFAWRTAPTTVCRKLLMRSPGPNGTVRAFSVCGKKYRPR
jgi:hypothetical protein